MAQTAIQTAVSPRRRRQKEAQRRRRQRRKCICLAAALILISVGALVVGSHMQSWLIQPVTTGLSQVTEMTGLSQVTEKLSTKTTDMTQEEKLAIIESEDSYPQRLVELAEKNEEAVDFVYQYPTLSQQHFTIDLSAEAEEDGVPLLLQWDTRWGYESYGDGLLAYTGCCPTTLSMVAIALEHDAQWTPLAVAQYADANGYYVNGVGSAWTLVSEGSAGLGLKAEVLPLDENRMKKALDAGSLIILNVGPGDFTDSGHFLVVTGYTDEGFSINDPNSRKNSEKIWSYDTLKGQIRNLWAMSV